MGVSIAEYLGQRTDVDSIQIQPALASSRCPFMDSECSKLNNRNHPVCAVRKTDNSLWIVCEHRLCATKRSTGSGRNKRQVPLTMYQQTTLLTISRTIFDSSVTPDEVCIKREVPLHVSDDINYKADYVMSLSSGRSPYSGPDRLILEMQGGGETTNTGNISSHVTEWLDNPSRTNQQLRQNISKANSLETNAWRRQQEQFLVKGSIAMKTWKGYGMAFCVGSNLYDYLMNRLTDANLPNLRGYNWTLALIGIAENTDCEISPGPIPLRIDNNRLLFTNYQTFVQALINQGLPNLQAFQGEFENLNGQTVNIS